MAATTTTAPPTIHGTLPGPPLLDAASVAAALAGADGFPSLLGADDGFAFGSNGLTSAGPTSPVYSIARRGRTSPYPM